MKFCFGGLLATLVLAASVRAEVVESVVDYVADQTAMKGVLIFDDASTDKRPAVVVVPEWWGVNEYAKARGRMLAGLGYVAFVADMYGNGNVTTDPKVAGEWAGAVKGDRPLMRTRVNAAVGTTKAQALVNAEKVAAIGYCFGGTTVIELALSGADVQGVASFHGGLEFPTLAADAGKVQAGVLVLHGDADPMVPATEVTALEDALKQAGKAVEIVRYESAAHGFTNPDADKIGFPGVKYNEAADKDSWEKLKKFLAKVFE